MAPAIDVAGTLAVEIRRRLEEEKALERRLGAAGPHLDGASAA